MHITLNLPKPRNPLVVLARQRRAGAHRPGTKSARQRVSRALMRELDTMKSPLP